MILSIIWLLMLGISIFCGIASGTGSALSGALMEGAQNAVKLALSLAGSLCLWSGFARLMERAGVTELLSKVLRPVLGRLYPQASQRREAFSPLCANVCANLLGLGNAATPLGIQAVRAMQRNGAGERASDEMCRLIVMNTASIQLLPTTVAALRTAHGAAKPLAILPAVWVTSVASVSAGLLACKVLQKWVR